MEWSDKHDLVVFVTEPYQHPYRSKERGDVWNQIAVNLNGLDHPKFKVSKRSITDRLTLLITKHKAKMRQEENTRWYHFRRDLTSLSSRRDRTLWERKFGRGCTAGMILTQHTLLKLNSCHHILPEKINPLLYLFAERHSLHSMSQSTTKILSFHDNV